MIADLVWPLPKLPDGRLPVISHEFEPGKHLGVDVMYHWHPGDSLDAPFAALDRHGAGKFIVPGHMVPVLAVADGHVIYARFAANGWRTRVEVSPAFHVLDLHMTRLFVQPGQHVKQGQMLGLCGGDPTDTPRCLIHDHHEHRRTAKAGEHREHRDGWGMVAYDPAAGLARAAILSGPAG